MERVVITGIGIVGPHGAGIEPILEAARSNTTAFTSWPDNVQPPHAHAKISRVSEFPSKRFFSDRQLRMMDRAMSLSSTAAGLAIEDADLSESDRRESCTFLGTARAELPSCYHFIQPQLGGKSEQLNAADFPKIARNISCGQIAVKYGMQGPSTVLASGSLASLEALARAGSYIRTGRAKVALVGGYESLSKFSLYFLLHLHREHLIAENPQFFGINPGFLVPSEGACMLILESASHANARGAKIYCSLDSWVEGRVGQDEDMDAVIENSWLRAIQRADADPKKLGLISVSAGGGNRQHEVAETLALNQFAKKGSEMQIFAPRSLVGEGESWAAALQVAMTAYMLHHGQCTPSNHVAEDTPIGLKKRLQGGVLPHPTAIVSGIGIGQNYSSFHLSKFSA